MIEIALSRGAVVAWSLLAVVVAVEIYAVGWVAGRDSLRQDIEQQRRGRE